jgi:hypothetical protein
VLEILEESRINVKLHKRQSDPLDAKITHGSVSTLAKSGLTVPETPLKVGLLSTWDWMQSCDLEKLRNWYEYSA